VCVSLTENWAAAPGEIRLAATLVVGGSVIGTTLYGTGVYGSHPLAAWLWVVNTLSGLALAGWLAWKLLTRRRWAWIVLWWLALFSGIGLVLAIGQSRPLIVNIVSFSVGLPELILLSRASVRSWERAESQTAL
jgi:hypothetical protein